MRIASDEIKFTNGKLPILVRYPSPKAGRSPRTTMKDLQNLDNLKTELKLKKILGFILALTAIGLTALMFVMVTKYKEQIKLPVCPHGFDC